MAESRVLETQPGSPIPLFSKQVRFLIGILSMKWWNRTDLNRRHPACKAGALPTELRPHENWKQRRRLNPLPDVMSVASYRILYSAVKLLSRLLVYQRV